MSDNQDSILNPLSFIEKVAKSGKIVPDPMGGDTVYYLPSDGELKLLNLTIFNDISLADAELQPTREKALRHQQAYELVGGSEERFFEYPLVRRDVDFSAAWLASAILRPEPIFDIDPSEDQQLTTIGPDGQPIQIQSHEAVKNIERGIEVILREHLDITRLIEMAAREVKMGKGPFWIKCGWKPSTQYVKRPKKKKEGVFDDGSVLANYDYEIQENGFPLRWIPKSVFDITYPLGYERYQDLPWIAERLHNATTWTVASYITNYGDACLLAPEMREAAMGGQALISGTDQTRDESLELGNQRPSMRSAAVDLREIYFDHPVRYVGVDASTGEPVKQVERMPMVGLFSMDSQSLVCMWFNDYSHQRKIFIPFFNAQRAFQLSDTSSADELVPIQAWVTEALTQELESKALANSTALTINPDVQAWDWFEVNEFGPGSRVPAREGEVNTLTIGRDSVSLLPNIQWMITQADKIGDVRRGERVPGRTSPNTVQQVFQSAVQEDMQTVMSFERSLKDLLRLSLDTIRQYAPTQQNIPNGAGKPSIPFSIPQDLDLATLQIHLTAASELSAKERDLNDLMTLANLLDTDSRITAEIFQPLANIQLTEGLAQGFEQMIKRKQIVMEAIFSKFRVDTRRLMINDDILAGVERDRQQLQMQAQQQAQAQQAQGGAPNGNPNAQPAPQDNGGGQQAPPVAPGGAAP